MSITSWKSPYQTKSYWEALSVDGIGYATLRQPDGSTIYLDLSEPLPTAWEVCNPANLITSNIGHFVMYLLRDSPGDPQKDSYCTLALSKDDPRFSKRYLRQVKKAQEDIDQPQLKLAETDRQLQEAIAQFEPYPERRDNIPMDRFQKRITALAEAGLILAYVLDSGNTSLGTSFVLRTDSQVNLRYYSAVRDMSAGHLLHFLSIEDMFTNQKIDTIDLSGISPQSGDKKLAGIDEFKYQIGGKLVEFCRHEIS